MEAHMTDDFNERLTKVVLEGASSVVFPLSPEDALRWGLRSMLAQVPLTNEAKANILTEIASQLRDG